MLFLAEMLKNNVKLSKFYCKLKKTIYIYTIKTAKSSHTSTATNIIFNLLSVFNNYI
jgi:hypothetical protein